MRVTINGTTYEFKTDFTEFSYSEFIPIATALDKPVLERLSIYTGVSVEILQTLSVGTFGALCEVLKPIEDMEMLNALSGVRSGKMVALESYGDMERAKRAMKKPVYEALIEVVKIYEDKDISGMELTEGWGLAMYYLDSLNKFFDRYKRLGEYKYSDEELEAGVEVFEGFAYFPTVIKIARERGLTNDQVLAMTAEEVYMELLLDFERSEFSSNYEKIVKERQEHFSKVGK
jgi:hypothetical protein